MFPTARQPQFSGEPSAITNALIRATPGTFGSEVVGGTDVFFDGIDGTVPSGYVAVPAGRLADQTFWAGTPLEDAPWILVNGTPNLDL